MEQQYWQLSSPQRLQVVVVQPTTVYSVYSPLLAAYRRAFCESFYGIWELFGVCYGNPATSITSAKHEVDYLGLGNVALCIWAACNESLLSASQENDSVRHMAGIGV